MTQGCMPLLLLFFNYISFPVSEISMKQVCESVLGRRPPHVPLSCFRDPELWGESAIVWNVACATPLASSFVYMPRLWIMLYIFLNAGGA